MLGLGLSPLSAPAQGRTAIQRAIASLRARGTDAHLWLPGVGTVSGLTTGNYLESTGNTLLTVDNPVGLVLDALGTVGSELVTNGGFDSDTGWTKSTGWSIAGGLAVASGALNNANINQPMTITQGKTYLVTINCVSYTSGSYFILMPDGNIAGGAAVTGAGYKRWIVTATSSSPSHMYLSTGETLTATFDNISVREVTGIHLTQGTTANKPILQKTDSKYSWTFDGSNDSLALGSVPFQMGDDHAIIAAAACTDTNTSYVFGVKGDDFKSAGSIVYVNGKAEAYWYNGGSAVELMAPTASSAMTVLTAVRRGGNRQLRINGAMAAESNAVLSDVAAITKAYIGGSSGGVASDINVDLSLTGTTGPVLTIKGTVTDAELLMYERLIAALTPGAPTF